MSELPAAEPSPFLFVSTYHRNKRRIKTRFQSFDAVLVWARANKLMYGMPSSSTPSVFALHHADGSPLAMHEALAIFRAINIPAYRHYQRQTIGNTSFPFEKLLPDAVKAASREIGTSAA